MNREHPGRITDSWFGVRYADGFRYDLAALEMIFCATVAILFGVLGRIPRRPGYYIRWIVVCGPLRFAIDSLREKPSLPIEALCLMVFGVAVFLLGQRQHAAPGMPAMRD
jgi:hypothetical protein